MGELYIRGSSLSHGYWNDRDRTDSVFQTNLVSNHSGKRVYRTGDIVKLLPDGNFVFVGRKDDQIKYLGYRIELGEIGSVLQLLDCVNDAAAMALAMEEHSVPEIVAFVELNGAADL